VIILKMERANNNHHRRRPFVFYNSSHIQTQTAPVDQNANPAHPPNSKGPRKPRRQKRHSQNDELRPPPLTQFLPASSNGKFRNKDDASSKRQNKDDASSSGCSSGGSVASTPLLTIEDDEIQAIEIIRETALLIHTEREENRGRSKSLRKPRAHYECLLGAMIKREQIQHEGHTLHDDRHYFDVHLKIYGWSKEPEEKEKERMERVARWILTNNV
ncbi:hypothetical protein PENTCL1PPCAC_29754, partial [Pristionchus entomophagus]